MRIAAWITLAVSVTVGGCNGCQENKTATAACSAQQNGPRCDGCCKSNGASLGALIQGVCSCRGGSAGTSGTNVGAPQTVTKISVPLKSIMAGGSYVFPPSSYTAKSIWNYALLNNEGSKGIHNLPFTNDVIGATNRALLNNPTAP